MPQATAMISEQHGSKTRGETLLEEQPGTNFAS